jgi:hypothetical protein
LTHPHIGIVTAAFIGIFSDAQHLKALELTEEINQQRPKGEPEAGLRPGDHPERASVAWTCASARASPGSSLSPESRIRASALF